ncbi:MAG: NTP transferase domain-containing protein [Paramuribaculum sp.]|nr:NTP transferase domain-containing protein [Paramuribaculum sp.]
MKAMVFAAGLGTRLKPLTDNMPKALVEVGREPMLGRVINKLINIGVDTVVVNVHHFPDMIRGYLHANNNFGIDIIISDEAEELLDTGGGILAAAGWLDDNKPFIVHNADILTDFSLKEMVDTHISTCADVTLLAQNRRSSRTFVYDDSLCLKGWARTGTDETIPLGLDVNKLRCLAFGGVSIVNPSVFPLMRQYAEKNGPVFSTTPFYASECSHLNIIGYMPSGEYRWFDIGKMETLVKAREAFT